MRLVASVRPSLVGLEPVGGNGPRQHDRCRAARGGAGRDRGVGRRGRVATRRRHRHREASARTGDGIGRATRESRSSSTGGGLTPATFADEDVQPSDLDIVACLCAEVGIVPAVIERRRPPPRWEWSRKWARESTVERRHRPRQRHRGGDAARADVVGWGAARQPRPGARHPRRAAERRRRHHRVVRPGASGRRRRVGAGQDPSSGPRLARRELHRPEGGGRRGDDRLSREPGA